MFDFDNPPSRLGTHTTKWDRYRERYGLDDVVPLWVADMDFACLDEVRDAIAARAQHPIYGYTDVDGGLAETVAAWERRQHRSEVDPGDIVWNTGVIYALYQLIDWLLAPSEKVIIQTPAYPPFFNTPRTLRRGVVFNPLKEEHGVWDLDIDLFRRQLDEDPSIRMFILCNPHNPVGRCWSLEQMNELFAVCEQHDVLIVSDEIHADIVRPGCAHVSALRCDPRFWDRLILLGAATKTFNLAGLKMSYTIIKDHRRQRDFAALAKANGLSSLNIFAIEAMRAAYTYGDAWKDACNAYIYDNLCYVQAHLAEHALRIAMNIPEATYLGWMDLRALDTPDDLNERLKREAGVEFQAGSGFGAAYAQFLRVNCACPRATLEKGMERFTGYLYEQGYR